MGYTRDRLERIVLGTMLNEFGNDGFMHQCSLSLRKDLFKSRQNAFVYSILDMMHNDGITSTTPVDVAAYAHQKDIKYGNLTNFLGYMCELAAENYAHNGFKKYVKELVTLYIKDKKHGTI